MNGWNTIKRCLVVGVVAVGMLVVPQVALADHCCQCDGTCITILDCGGYHCCGPCGPGSCGSPGVYCPFPSAADEPQEGTDDEIVSSESQPEADAPEGEARAESGAAPIRGAVGPVSTEAAPVDPAAEMDVGAEVSIADPSEDGDSAKPPEEAFIPACKNICNSPGEGCARLSCDPCCWLCGGYEVCILPPPPGP